MATSLTGFATETQLTDAQRARLESAIRELEPDADHPSLGGALEVLRGYLPEHDGTHQFVQARGAVKRERASIAKSDLDPLEPHPPRPGARQGRARSQRRDRAPDRQHRLYRQRDGDAEVRTRTGGDGARGPRRLRT
jgi:hypothetical protein